MKQVLMLFAVTAILAACTTSTPTPTPSSSPACTGVWHQDEGDFTAYVGDDGKDHKCSKPGGACKSSKGYNGCSASAELCCKK